MHFMKITAVCLAIPFLVSLNADVCNAGGKIRNPGHGVFKIKNDTNQTIHVGLYAAYQEGGRGVVRFWGYRRILPYNVADFGYSEFHSGGGKKHTFYLYSTATLNTGSNPDLFMMKAFAPFPRNGFDRSLQNAGVTRDVVRGSWNALKAHWRELDIRNSECRKIVPRTSGKGFMLWIKSNGRWSSLVSR